LPRNFRDLLIFGDSYSTADFCVPWAQSFWGLAAQRLAVQDIWNFSQPGYSLDMISHLVISQRDRLHDQSLVLICVPPLERVTWHDNTNQSCAKTVHIKQGNTNISDVAGTTGLVNDPIHAVVPEMAKILERSWTEHQGLQKMFLLYHFLGSTDAAFVIMNMCSPFVRNPGWPDNDLCDWFASKPNTIIFDKTYAGINHGVNPPVDYDQFGWQGHHGVDGNAKFFYESLWPVIEACYIK